MDAADARQVQFVSTCIRLNLARLEPWLDKPLAGRQRESHSGGAREKHDGLAAERWPMVALGALGLKASELEQLGKRAPYKEALAWWLRKQTTVSLRWMAERLEMGHYTSVTPAVSRMNRKPGKALAELGQRLEKSRAHDCNHRMC
ncbi:MAG TPA: hypothetical protein PKI20_21420 [Verrucomicrobiota bacterium]|jgi:hypothetical protein|nr:hypothetical protein [Verrucomicrobiota bacterium]HQL80321.1 hypothetical protein [Verrucomicrobiota bacterium]